jgi:hypothetical protein
MPQTCFYEKFFFKKDPSYIFLKNEFISILHKKNNMTEDLENRSYGKKITYTAGLQPLAQIVY